MVFQKKGEKVASNARQSFNQSSNNMGVRIVWCKKGVCTVRVHPSYALSLLFFTQKDNMLFEITADFRWRLWRGPYVCAEIVNGDFLQRSTRSAQPCSKKRNFGSRTIFQIEQKTKFSKRIFKWKISFWNCDLGLNRCRTLIRMCFAEPVYFKNPLLDINPLLLIFEQFSFKIRFFPRLNRECDLSNLIVEIVTSSLEYCIDQTQDYNSKRVFACE